ncbi:Hypothetical predicted protein [Olea europaea subsp. europaea]|uniref:Uncharacterized protein n=1 Tax=Olea europaea subsp. europaea TaxID=158383 RepID=A0A8S0QJJ9_OLEEU|nr:Hypothetical predicted protein [Olea europaea subsp. europaea]
MHIWVFTNLSRIHRNWRIVEEDEEVLIVQKSGSNFDSMVVEFRNFRRQRIWCKLEGKCLISKFRG